jgi:hypothetical protein
MNEEPNSIWKKSFTGRKAVLIWVLLTSVVVLLGILIPALVSERPVADYFGMVAVVGLLGVAVCCFIIYVAVPVLRWLFWKHWSWTLLGLVCLGALVALFYAEEDWRGKHDWNQFKHQWEARGEHFDYASIVPPPVPDDQNFALTPVVSTCYSSILDKSGHRLAKWDTNVVNRLSMNIARDYSGGPTNGGGNWQKATLTDLKPWQDYYRNLAAKTNLFPVAPQPQTPALDVLLALSKYDSTIEDLRRASQLPHSRFPLDYDNEDPAEIVLPHLAALKRVAQVLQLRALAELQKGQTDQAFADVNLMLYLVNCIRTEPILISHLVRIAMLQITLQPVYEGLVKHQWSDAQLVELDSELAKLDFLASYKLSMRGEMAMQGGIIEYLRRHPEQIYNLMEMSDEDGNPNSRRWNSPARLIPSGWFYQNRLRCARMMVEYYIPMADVDQGTVSPTAARRAAEAVDADTRKVTPYNILERMMMPALGAAVKKFAYGQSCVDLARMAIALERCRLARGAYPESLDALAPKFIAQIPHDVIGGEPLHYQRTADGQFVLYSVGWNETDDGGVVAFREGGSRAVDISRGDWVWRYPKKE